MNNVMNDLILYFEYPFVRYALIVGVLISVCSALFGVILVLKRFSFIGDGLSHVAFLSFAIAGILNFTNDMLIVLPVTIICAVFILNAHDTIKANGDAIIAMASVSSLGLGYLFMNLFAKSSNVSKDVCSTLFGSTSILTLRTPQLILSIVLSIIVILFFILYYNKIFAITFDEDFVVSKGVNVRLYNFISAIIIAVIIVLAMNLVGSLLISAFIIFPCMSAMQIKKSFKGVIIFSVIFSVLVTFIGILIAILWGTPVGSTIVLIDIIGFIICVIIGRFK